MYARQSRMSSSVSGRTSASTTYHSSDIGLARSENLLPIRAIGADYAGGFGGGLDMHGGLRFGYFFNQKAGDSPANRQCPRSSCCKTSGEAF